MIQRPTNTDLLDIYKKELLDIIKHIIPDCKVILFGSRATGKSKEGSDIDIALNDMGRPIPFDTIMDIYIALEDSTIPVKVDLVDIQTADDTIKAEILKKGIVWKA